MNKENLEAKKVINLNGVELAFLGDAVYTLLARQHLIESGVVGSKELNQKLLDFTPATKQFQAYQSIMDILDEFEIQIFKRGRNSKVSTVPHGATMSQYRDATGLEALFGALWIEQKYTRVQELFAIIVQNSIQTKDKK